MAQRQASEYKYRRLATLRLDEHVNVYGVLKYANEPSLTKTNQYCMNLGLVDESLDIASGDNLHCILFAKTQEELPMRANPGDIIRFHRLRIVYYNGKLQGKMGAGFSWLLIKDDHKEASSERFTFTGKDEMFVSNMQRWASTDRNVLSALRKSNEDMCLCELSTEELWFNTVVQVYSVCPSVNDEACQVIRVWDGTIPMCQSYNPCMPGEPYEEPPEELQRYATKRILDFHVYDDHQEQARTLHPGEFIRVTNIHSRFVDLTRQHTVSGNLFDPEFEAHPYFLNIILHKGTVRNRGIIKLNGTEPGVEVVKKRIKALIQANDAVNGGTLASTSGSNSSSVSQAATGSASNIASVYSSNSPSASPSGAKSTDVPHASTGSSAIASVIASNDTSRNRTGAASNDVHHRASAGASASTSNIASNVTSRSRTGAASNDVHHRASAGASAITSNIASIVTSRNRTGAASNDVHHRESAGESAIASNIASSHTSRNRTGAASNDVHHCASTGASASTSNIASNDTSWNRTGAASNDVHHRASAGASAIAFNIASSDTSRNRTGTASNDVHHRASTGASASTSNIASNVTSRSRTGTASNNVHHRASTGASASTSNIASNVTSRSRTGTASNDVPHHASTGASASTSNIASNVTSRSRTGTASNDVPHHASTGASASTSNIASNVTSRSRTGAASNDVHHRASAGASAIASNIASSDTSRNRIGTASNDVPHHASTGASASTSNIASNVTSRSRTGTASNIVPHRASTGASASRSTTDVASTKPTSASNFAMNGASTMASSKELHNESGITSGSTSSKRKTDAEIYRKAELAKKVRVEVKHHVQDSAIWKSSTSGDKSTSNVKENVPSTSKDELYTELNELHQLSQGPANSTVTSKIKSANEIKCGDLLDIMARETTPAKFSCNLQLTDIQPRTVGEGVNITCEACKFSMCLKQLPQQVMFTDVNMKCVNCKADLKEEYAFVLTLEDDFGTVEAELTGKDAEMFFLNTPASESRRNKEIHDKLGQMINTLVSSLDNATEKPWVDCVIEAFHEDSDVDSYRVSDVQMPVGPDDL